jgi:hypothetical protein
MSRAHLVKAYLNDALSADLDYYCQALRCSQSSFIAASLGVHMNMLKAIPTRPRAELKGQLQLIERDTGAQDASEPNQT